MTNYTLPGYYNNADAKKVEKKLQGKTYMNFNVEYGGAAGNNTIVVTTTELENGLEERNELMEMVIFVLATA